jgi:hypothetical protein
MLLVAENVMSNLRMKSKIIDRNVQGRISCIIESTSLAGLRKNHIQVDCVGGFERGPFLLEYENRSEFLRILQSHSI